MSAQVLHWPSVPEQSAFPWPEDFGPARTAKIAPIDTMDTGDYTAVICGAIRRHFDGTRDAAKACAVIANTNARTAKNWLNGVNPPDGLHLLRLAARIPELAGEVRRLTGMHADIDPEFERDFMKFQQSMAIFMDSKRGGDR
jgi:hypothetical protein